MNSFSNKVLDSDASALPGRPFCWSNLHLPPNILRPTTAGRPLPCSPPPQATPTLTLRSTPLPLWPAPRSPRRPPGCLPNLRPSRRPRACFRCRRGSSLPRSWRPRRPQCCPGRHEPRRASRRWPRPRDTRQRARPVSWPTTGHRHHLHQPHHTRWGTPPRGRYHPRPCRRQCPPAQTLSLPGAHPGPPLPPHRFRNRGWRPLG